MLQLSKKQNEYILKADKRWNLKTGAVRSGKSFVDTAYIIPMRIRERAGKPGLNVILGVSKSTIERNVLAPMREIYTEKLIGTINNQNIAIVCGEEVYCLGAEKINQVAKIQGASIKYAYGDEVAKWNKEVFEMLKSRLDKEYSCFDGSLNPEQPTHWLKSFIDTPDLDIYLQTYTIFDNPFLPADFVRQLCKEYEGTIYYDRLILGLWKRAEGAIYKKFADNPMKYRCEVVEEKNNESETRQFLKEEIETITVGIDFGGNQSGHSLVSTGFTEDLGYIVPLQSQRIMAADNDEEIDSNKLSELAIEFIQRLIDKYAVVVRHGDKVRYCNVETVYWDNAETVLGNTIRNAVEDKFPWIVVRPAKKVRIKNRIQCTVALMGAKRFYITEDCQSLQQALCDAVYDMKSAEEDVRLDDGTSDIDSLDSFEYTFEREISSLIETEGR